MREAERETRKKKHEMPLFYAHVLCTYINYIYRKYKRRPIV